MLKHSLPILIPVAVLTVVASIIRGLALGDGLWIDELHTSWVVTDSVWDIGPRARLGNQQPLYFYLPWLSIQCFGESEWALRLPSFVAGAALIPALYGLTRWLTSSHSAGLVVATLATLDQQWLFYAQEARGYSIIQLSALVQFALVYHLSRSEDTPWKGRLAFIILSAAMFYLHYTTALLTIAAVVALGLASTVGGNAYRLRSLLCDSVAIVGLTLPAFAHVWDVAERRENWQMFVAQPTWTGLFIIPFGIYVLVPWFMAGVTAIGRRLRPVDQIESTDKQREEITAGFFTTMCWLFVPLLIALVTTWTDLARLYFPRYLIGISAPAMIVAGFAIAVQRRTWSRIMISTIVLYLAAWSGGWLHPRTFSSTLSEHTDEGWREAAAAIRLQEQGERLGILIDPGLIETDAWHASVDPLQRAYCSMPVRGIYDLAEGDREIIPFLRQRPIAGDDIQSGQDYWVLVRGKIPGSIQIASREIAISPANRQNFGSVNLCRITVSAPL